MSIHGPSRQQTSGQDRPGAALIHVVLSARVICTGQKNGAHGAQPPNSTALHVDLHATILIRVHEGRDPIVVVLIQSNTFKQNRD
jgi:hypothetical protein